jgi:hypothetical protein
MILTDSEKEMLDGRHGKACQKAMELLIRYAEALAAERFVDTRNVAGVPGSANPFLQNYYPGIDSPSSSPNRPPLSRPPPTNSHTVRLPVVYAVCRPEPLCTSRPFT